MSDAPPVDWRKAQGGFSALRPPLAPCRLLGLLCSMPNYRRVFVPGGCYFFTVNLRDRNSRLLIDHIDLLRDAVRVTRRNYPFEIDAMVILPDHIHAVWTLPDGDANFPTRWRSIKIRFSKAIPADERPAAGRTGEPGIWQRRYWEHVIRDERDLDNHIDYCWFNPVKHGHVANVEDWPFSTFHRDNSGSPKSGDFEKTLADYARKCGSGAFGERE
jgi:putative transposase